MMHRDNAHQNFTINGSASLIRFESNGNNAFDDLKQNLSPSKRMRLYRTQAPMRMNDFSSSDDSLFSDEVPSVPQIAESADASDSGSSEISYRQQMYETLEHDINKILVSPALDDE